MDLRCIALSFVLLCLPSPPLAQVPGVPPPSPPGASGEVSGIVVSDFTGRPLYRAQVILKPLDADSLPRLATTNETGGFDFPAVRPGRYTIVIQRDGYLSLGGSGLPAGITQDEFSVSGDARLGNFVFRLHPTAVIAGRIKYGSDAEPAVGAVVELYREHRVRGRHGFALAGRALTDDRGEYRIHGVTPGSYVVAATRQRPPEAAGAVAEPRRDLHGLPLSDEAFALTFYPNGQKLMDAVPVKVAYGGEAVGIDIFLESVPSIHIRGRVTTPAGVPDTISVEVHRADARGGAGIRAAYDVALRKGTGEFEIHDVTPGPYLVIVQATAGSLEFAARAFLEVTNTPIDNLEIAALLPLFRRGSIVVAGAQREPATNVRLVLEPRDEDAGVASTITDEAGQFGLILQPGLAYDVLVGNLPENTYVKSIRAGNDEALRNGLFAEALGDRDTIDIVLGTDSGQISGNVVDRTGLPGTDARVTLIPDPSDGRWQQYASGAVAADGSFALSGVAPGHYLILATHADPPCDIYDSADLGVCRRQAIAINLDASGHAFLALQLP